MKSWQRRKASAPAVPFFTEQAEAAPIMQPPLFYENTKCHGVTPTE
jgi:hypothetical protein